MILCAVRWYCRFALSCRDVWELLAKRGFKSLLLARATLRGIEAIRTIKRGQVHDTEPEAQAKSVSGWNIAVISDCLHRDIGRDRFQLCFLDQLLIDAIEVIHVSSDNLQHIVIVTSDAEEIYHVLYA